MLRRAKRIALRQAAPPRSMSPATRRARRPPAAVGPAADGPATARALRRAASRDRRRRSRRAACSSRRAFSTASAGGGSSQGKSSRSPSANNCSSGSAKSLRSTSGVSAGGRPRCDDSSHSRQQTPGAVRPARPARCSADACEIGTSSSRGNPVAGDTCICRACPESITAVTPSIVSDVSATLVARMILRCPRSASTRSCCSGGRSPNSGSSASPCRSASGASASCSAKNLAHARQEHQHVPRRVAQCVRHRRRDQLRPAAAARRAAGSGSAPETAAPRHARSGNRPSSRATGSAASVALITTIRRSGRSVWRIRTRAPARGPSRSSARETHRARPRRRLRAPHRRSNRRNRMPVVTTTSRVSRPRTTSKRT